MYRGAALLRLTSFLIAACLLAASCHASRRVADDRPASLEAVVRAVRDRYRLPALGAVAVRPDGSSEVCVLGLRRADSSTPVSRDDRWHLGSNTKAFTATLIARLVEIPMPR